MGKSAIRHRNSDILIKIGAVILEFRIMFFFILSVVYLELIYRLWLIKNISFDFIFPVFFAVTAGGVLFLISGLFSKRTNKKVAVSMVSVLVLFYIVQLVYYCVFQTPFSFYSMTGAGDAVQFWDVVLETVLKNIIAIILFCAPIAVLLSKRINLTINKVKKPALLFILLFCVLSYGFSILCVNLTGDGNVSQYTLYYKTYSPQLSVNKLGLLTTMRLDLEKLALGNAESTSAFNSDGESGHPASSSSGEGDNQDTSTDKGVDSANTSEAANETDSQVAGASTSVPVDPEDQYNKMDIDFDSLIANETDETLLDMHKYFNSVEPTKKNQFTGMFKGYNLIFITAEGFSNYAISKELTPTLYKMKNEGFVFNNFYNPVWGVSTSDGEYVACTGLMPKGGIWSFAKSGENYMPFVMGNQFKKLGYPTKAYHDHTYTYYKRNISHPNMGYDYKGIGNGLELKKTWPESDLEMINVTAPEYISQQPFHTYYMTVSGHLQYTFKGNYQAYKNKAYVENLSYSEPCKAYIACNLEFEFAMKALMDKLEAAGIAEKTVIAISPDHYPYGLPRENIDEFAGHKVDDTFELYRSALIIYCKGMTPVIVDKPCASLDINPTLSNLFGLEYDSRLLMGRDILSNASPLVTFSSMSWITDRARYNSSTNKAEFTDRSEYDKEYVRSINKIVSGRYKYSAKILDTDYYRKVVR